MKPARPTSPRRSASGEALREGSVPGARSLRQPSRREVCAPLNGRAYTSVRQPLSGFACACDYRARARRCESVRRPKTFGIALTLLLKVLLQVEGLFLENVRNKSAPGTCSLFGEPIRRAFALGVVVLTGLYGFMKCKQVCVSSVVCVSWMEYNYSNCLMSWRKPGGRAEVRTQDPCPMVRKDTNSKTE